MSIQRLKLVVGSFESVAFSSGLFVAVLVACGKTPAPVPAPAVPAPPAPVQTLSTSIQGNWLIPQRPLTDPSGIIIGSDFYTYKFGPLIPNQPTTLIIERSCILTGQIQPLFVQISVPVETIVLSQPPGAIATTTPTTLRILGTASASKTLYGFNCALNISPTHSSYVISGNTLTFNPNTPNALSLIRTP